jgi:hypothetical protein
MKMKNIILLIPLVFILNVFLMTIAIYLICLALEIQMPILNQLILALGAIILTIRLKISKKN